MTIYISPNPGKTSANEIALRAAQILLTHGAAVLMCKELCVNAVPRVWSICRRRNAWSAQM